MTKWICSGCSRPCELDLSRRCRPPFECPLKLTWVKWGQVEEPPIKDCPPITRTVTVSRDEFNNTMLNNHEASIQEMAGNLAALSDRVGTLEYTQAIPHNHGALIDAADALKERVQSLEYSEVNVVKRLGECMERIEKLEHQMRKL